MLNAENQFWLLVWGFSITQDDTFLGESRSWDFPEPQV